MVSKLCCILEKLGSFLKTLLPGSYSQALRFNWYGMCLGIRIFKCSSGDSNVQWCREPLNPSMLSNSPCKTSCERVCPLGEIGPAIQIPGDPHPYPSHLVMKSRHPLRHDLFSLKTFFTHVSYHYWIILLVTKEFYCKFLWKAHLSGFL